MDLRDGLHQIRVADILFLEQLSGNAVINSIGSCLPRLVDARGYPEVDATLVFRLDRLAREYVGAFIIYHHGGALRVIRDRRDRLGREAVPFEAGSLPVSRSTY